MDDLLDPSDVQDVLHLIEDGFLFERFAQEFLAARLGYKFISSGGLKDRGIDGLQYASEIDSTKKSIFQISIDKKPTTKIKDTVDKLNDNQIEYTTLYYVTNIEVKNKDLLIDDYQNNDGINLRIYDGKWLSQNTNHNQATLSVVKTFIDQHLRKYQNPGEGFVVSDFVSNPRLYVYLMQQIGNDSEINNLNEKLIDSLILYSLRDTDPAIGVDKFLSAEEILEEIRNLLKFEIERIQSKINRRLKVLSKKPNRKINYHTDINKYCLPYDTRLQILANNAKNKIEHESFIEEAEKIIRNNLKGEGVSIQDVAGLLGSTLENIYYNQGLEFSEFLLNGGCKDTFENNLHDTVSDIVNNSNIVDKNLNKVKTALVMSIRDLLYSSSIEAKSYLRSLSRTYQMLFLLKCEPSIVNYFLSMAGDMRIFVCTSILIPALSEIYLDPQNQRYWSLLKSANLRGVKLLINETILDELDFHINRSKHIYETEYARNIDFYSDGSTDLVDQILVKAYIYALKEKRIKSYDDFLSNYITVNGSRTKQELIDFLSAELGIEFISDTQSEYKVEIDQSDFDALVKEVAKYKKSDEKAKADAKIILTIYSLREKNNESRSTLHGYKTWWLSSDTITHKAVSTLFNKKYPVSCYIRPDFFYNYISFTPALKNVKDAYKNIFPNMLGVQISNHISPVISASIREAINSHSDKLDGRRKAKIRTLVDELKTDPKLKYQNRLKSFFQDDE